MNKDFELKKETSINFLKEYNKNSYVCFSGGKDSLVALDLALKSGIKNAVFCDTTMEFQETLDYINTVEDFYEIKVQSVTAPAPFFELVHKIGFPSRPMRWCCKVYKFSPLAVFARENRVKSYITGLRSEENIRRKQYSKIDENHLIDSKQINPILDWSSKDIWDYIKQNNLPINPLYNLGFKRVGCWPCPFKSKIEWSLIKKFFPDKLNLLDKTLKSIFKNCEGVGIKNLDDFIKNFKWAGYRRPQNSELQGKIEYIDDMTLIHLENMSDLKKVEKFIPILSKEYEVIRNSIMIKKKLRKQSLKILVEKALNCVGCGACVAFCDSLRIEENHLDIDIQNCTSCSRCIKTSTMRGACIMRNFSPYRIEIGTCQNFSVENGSNEIHSLNSRVGLIRTRAKLEDIIEKLEKYAEIKKFAQYVSIKNGKLSATAYKSKGYVEIKIYPNNKDLEKTMNYFRGIIT